jgi:hypothetical protein
VKTGACGDTVATELGVAYSGSGFGQQSRVGADFLVDGLRVGWRGSKVGRIPGGNVSSGGRNLGRGGFRGDTPSGVRDGRGGARYVLGEQMFKR